MKIWEAKLSLYRDGKGGWMSSFEVKTDGKEYKLVYDTYFEDKTGWFRNEIPSKIQVEQNFGDYLVTCGFTECPTEHELDALECEMKQILGDYIEHEFSQYKETFKSKIKGLFSDSK